MAQEVLQCPLDPLPSHRGFLKKVFPQSNGRGWQFWVAILYMNGIFDASDSVVFVFLAEGTVRFDKPRWAGSTKELTAFSSHLALPRNVASGRGVAFGKSDVSSKKKIESERN